MASLILKRRSSDVNKLLFHNPLIRSAAAAAPPSDCLLPVTGIRPLSDISQTRSFSQMMGPITNNMPQGTRAIWNDAKQRLSQSHGLGAAAIVCGGGSAIRRYSTQTVRPLSPHLSVYKPQSTSMGSIFHRISFLYLVGVITFYYLMYIKMGMICLTYDSFNWVLFYTSKLNSILAELSGVAALYYVYHGVHEFLQFRSGGIKTGLTKLLRFSKK